MIKKLFVGVDEAGYGPNLGPLIVAASVWSAPPDFSEAHFATHFAERFLSKPWFPGCGHVSLGDSKQLYQAGGGLATLEAGLLVFAALQANECRTLGQLLLQTVASEQIAELDQQPWYGGCSELPLAGSLGDACGTLHPEIHRLRQLAQDTLQKCGLEFVGLRAAVITESAFNNAVAKSGSKGQLLSQTTLELVASVLRETTVAAEVFCDRQGGRKNYLPNLLEAFPEEWFRETAVSQSRSSYCNQCPDRNLQFHFSVGGDRFPPTALASMLAKYLRERLMESLNAYWGRQLPDLRPTAGYPQDAKRFRKCIEPVAERLNLQENSWWRCK